MRQHGRQVGVLAHFDTAAELSAVNRSLLDCLLEVCDRVVIVTTSPLRPTGLDPDRVEVIERPNMGYDFYSYRVGLSACVERHGFDGLFLVNTSFMVCHRERFCATLVAMATRAEGAAVTGLSESLQFEPHLQTYLVHFTREAVLSPPFQAWAASIEPQPDKMQMILRYELGMTRTLRQHGLNHAALFSETPAEQAAAMARWQNCNLSEQRHFDGSRSAREVALVPASAYNPVHFSARALAERHGLVKSELVRTNPHRLDIDWLPKLAEAPLLAEIRASVEQSKRDYVHQDDGLTVFNGQAEGLTMASSGPLGRAGVDIAVVVHVFYPELIREIRGYLGHILEPFDLFVTTPHEAAVSQILTEFSLLCSAVCVVLHRNVGRDIGPFMSVYRSGLLDGYKAVLKTHSKQSKYSNEGAVWRRQLYGALCGDAARVRSTLDLLRRPQVGLVGPDASFLTHEHFWGGNKARVTALLSSVGVIEEGQALQLGFFAGSMFWFKPRALRLLKSIPWERFEFEPEAGQRDATLAHAIERIFSDLACFLGYLSTTVELAGSDVRRADLSNKVVVLNFDPSKPSS